MKSVILPYLILYKPLGYAVAFFGMVIGGDETVFIASFLTRQGIFEFWLMLAIILAGVFFGDKFWYRLGVKFKNSNFFILRLANKIASPFDQHLVNKPGRTIFISKFAYGFNHAILIRAGVLGIEQKKVLKSDAIAIIIWILIIGCLGYFSSAYVMRLRHLVRFTEVALLIFLVAFLALDHIVAWLLKKEL